MRYDRSQFRAQPMSTCRYVEEIGSAAMLAANRSVDVTQDLCQVRTSLPTLALKPRGDNTRSPKQGYQWPTAKILKKAKITLRPSSFFVEHYEGDVIFRRVSNEIKKEISV